VATITAHKPEDAGEWSEEERSLLQTLIDQLSVALESARLYEETRRRALREQQAGQITSLIRETLDIDVILKTAVSELGQALGDVEVAVALSPEDIRQ